MIRQEIKNLIEKSIKELQKEGKLPDFDIPEIKVERPEEKIHGDYSTNVVMAIAKIAKKSPMEIANLINSRFDIPRSRTSSLRGRQHSIFFEKIEVAIPGFINFFLSKEYLQEQVKEILKQKEKFGELEIGRGKSVNIEFISANPTGPLHIGNGRGGFCGDVLSNVLEKAEYKITREYYINDVGRQALFLENSLYGREPSYKNQYIDDLKSRGEKNVKKAVKDIVDEIKKTTERMGIKFDKWFYESELYKNKLYKKKEADKVLSFLKKKNLTYEKEGALWFKSSQFGDDKDRVLIKKDDKETYFLSDIAYLRNKFKRGFDCLIIFLGAEHHGYIDRLRAAAEALGYNRNRVKPIIMQLVNLVEKGKEVRMSKRTGIFVTIDELINEVGKDVTRFFFLTRSPGSHLVFDLDLAKEQSEKNPVYYVQYAHARICSIFKKINTRYKIPRRRTFGSLRGRQNTRYKLLSHPNELELIKQLIRLPEIIEDTAKDYQVQRIPQYALDLATSFHQFYRDCRVLTDYSPPTASSRFACPSTRSLSEARLALILATKIVLKNTLDLMGISVPEKM